MNKIFTLVLITTLFTFRTFAATNHIVTAQNYVFTPQNFNCLVGDTVTWEFIGGIEHEPASFPDSIPNGAANWDFIISSSTTTGSYVVTQPGTYYYECKFHFASEGMAGLFTATLPTGIATVEEPTTPVMLYPMPFQNKLTINADYTLEFKNNVTIEISNILGQQKFSKNYTEALSAPLTLDLSELTPGIYFISLSEGTIRKTYRIVKSE